jgi:hypothetical protein
MNCGHAVCCANCKNLVNRVCPICGIKISYFIHASHPEASGNFYRQQSSAHEEDFDKVSGLMKLEEDHDDRDDVSEPSSTQLKKVEPKKTKFAQASKSSSRGQSPDQSPENSRAGLLAKHQNFFGREEDVAVPKQANIHAYAIKEESSLYSKLNDSVRPPPQKSLTPSRQAINIEEPSQEQGTPRDDEGEEENYQSMESEENSEPKGIKQLEQSRLDRFKEHSSDNQRALIFFGRPDKDDSNDNDLPLEQPVPKENVRKVEWDADLSHEESQVRAEDPSISRNSEDQSRGSGEVSVTSSVQGEQNQRIDEEDPDYQRIQRIMQLRAQQK